MATPRNEILSKTLTGIFAGSAGAVFPNLQLMLNPSGQAAQLKFNFAVWLLSIQMTTSLTVYPDVGNPPGLGGIVVTIGQQPSSLSVDEGLESQTEHFTAANSIAGPPAFALPSSKVSTRDYPGCGRLLAPSEPISLYASANTNAAGNYLFAMCSIFYRTVGQ